MQKDIELGVRRFSARLDSGVHFVGEQRPALFWTTDTALRFTSAQGSFALLNLQPDRLIGTNLSDTLQRQNPDLHFLNAHQRALEGTSSRFTATLGNRVFDLHIEPFRGPDGKICGAIGAALETTRRKPAESASGASERRFRALSENSSDMIALVAADGTILYASPSTTRVLGYPLEEFVGRSAFEFIHPDDCERTTKLLVELLEKSGGSVAMECRLLGKEGTWRWIEGTGNNLLAEPSVQAIVINYRDISERKRAEEALRQSEARYRVVAETATDAFVTIGSSSQILFVNAAAERIFGYSRAEMLGQDAGVPPPSP